LNLPDFERADHGLNSAPSRKRIFLVGLIVGALATLVFYIGTEFLGLPYPPEAIYQLLVAPVPGSIQSVAVENLRQYAKYGALTFASIVYTILYGAISVGLGSLSNRRFGKWSLIAIGTIVTTALALGLEAVFASSVSILSTLSGWALVAVLALAVNVSYSSFVVSNLRIGTTTVQPRVALAPGRRKMLKRVGFGVLGIALAVIVAKLGLSLLSGEPIVQSNTPIPVNTEQASTTLTGAPSVFSDPRIADLVASEVTDTRIFYRVDID